MRCTSANRSKLGNGAVPAPSVITTSRCYLKCRKAEQAKPGRTDGRDNRNRRNWPNRIEFREAIDWTGRKLARFGLDFRLEQRRRPHETLTRCNQPIIAPGCGKLYHCGHNSVFYINHLKPLILITAGVGLLQRISWVAVANWPTRAVFHLISAETLDGLLNGRPKAICASKSACRLGALSLGSA
jgi:hypothetical protein